MSAKKLNVKINWSTQQYKELESVWYEAKVPQIDWTYVVDYSPTDPTKYTCFLLFDSTASFQEVRLTKKEYKRKEQAMVFCEKHLHKFLLKLKKFFL